MDDELIGEFVAHPGILSYSSLEFADGDWGNLILLDGDAAAEQWRDGERHAYAARELAPRHYRDVRLHRGVLPDGVRGTGQPILRRTKYYDYRDGVTWRAERGRRIEVDPYPAPWPVNRTDPRFHVAITHDTALSRGKIDPVHICLTSFLPDRCSCFVREPSSMEPNWPQTGAAQVPIISGVSWSGLAPLTFHIALITQRSLVQIQPPQPRNSTGYGTHRSPLGFSGNVRREIAT